MPDLQSLELANAWPPILLAETLRYLLAASTLALTLFCLRNRLTRRRTQQRKAGASDIRREVTYSMLTAGIFSLFGLGIHAGSQLGIFRIDTTAQLHTGAALMDFVLLVLLHDAYFYWIHRAMHCPRLYRAFHRLHHRSRTPTPWAAYAFAPLEAVLEAAFLPLILLIYPTSGIVVFLFTTHMIVRNVVGHAGVELFPRRWFQWPILRAFTTTTHHDLHHCEFRWNYGLYFTWWDRMMGTEHPHYRQRFAQSTGSSVVPSPPQRSPVLALTLFTAIAAFAATRAMADEPAGPNGAPPVLPAMLVRTMLSIRAAGFLPVERIGRDARQRRQPGMAQRIVEDQSWLRKLRIREATNGNSHHARLRCPVDIRAALRAEMKRRCDSQIAGADIYAAIALDLHIFQCKPRCEIERAARSPLT